MPRPSPCSSSGQNRRRLPDKPPVLCAFLKSRGGPFSVLRLSPWGAQAGILECSMWFSKLLTHPPPRFFSVVCLAVDRSFLFFVSLPFFSCLAFAQVALELLLCLAALPLLGGPRGSEGCQHSVQPQPFQALWVLREAKSSVRGRQQPAPEDSGKPKGFGFSLGKRRRGGGGTRLRHAKLCIGWIAGASFPSLTKPGDLP